MKRKLFEIALVAMVGFGFVKTRVSAESDNFYTNINGIVFSQEKYDNFLNIGYSDEEIQNMSTETFNSYSEMDMSELDREITKYFRETIVSGNSMIDEISEYEYEN